MVPIYLDNNATTPVDPEVLEAMLPCYRESFGNPSSQHGPGKGVRAALNKAREEVALLVNCDPMEVVFTSGGSESLNTALKGVAAARRARGNHIVTTRIEHPAVYNTCRYLEREGFRVTYLDVDAEGSLDLQALCDAITEQTVLIAVMYANNETGTLLPVKEVAAIAAEHGIYSLSDTVQAVGKVPLDFRASGLNLMVLSGHKLYAPKGIGALVIKESTQVRPLIHGGGQERHRRAGTENTAGIIALGKACELARARMSTDLPRIQDLRDRLEQGLFSAIPGLKLNGRRDARLPNTLNLAIPGVFAETLLEALDLVGIAASAGSACSAGSKELSRVLSAMGLSDELIRSSVRFSLGRHTSPQDIDTVLKVLPGLVDKHRGSAP